MTLFSKSVEVPACVCGLGPGRGSLLHVVLLLTKNKHERSPKAGFQIFVAYFKAVYLICAIIYKEKQMLSAPVFNHVCFKSRGWDCMRPL